jgi:DNA-binding LacI/PurR family transcriptional regulator/anti-anti-sigma regulatory factor
MSQTLSTGDVDVKNNRNETKTRRIKAQNARPTIGFLAGNVSSVEIAYPNIVWNGVADAARERGANLICFAGGMLNFTPLGEFEVGSNMLYDLALADVDGLVISSGALGFFVPMEELQGFCDHYRSLPVVSIAVALEGIPSVLVDNVTGLRDAVSHLIEVHGHRRIAFLRGPEGHQEAEARYRAYTEALAVHGLALDPDLVTLGEFTRASGVTAMRLLLDERKLRPGVDFEAVVASVDRMALGALDELHERDIRVPYDVAVVGFDDAEEAKVASPALTTVRQPVYEQAKRATDMVLALLAGEDVPEQVTLPTEMVVRQSCGCHSQTVLQAAVDLTAGHLAGETFEEALVTRREEILTAMAQALGGEAASAMTFEWAGQLLDGFAAAMGDESPGRFLSALDRVLRVVSAASGVSSTSPSGGSERSVAAWQGAISALRRHVLPWLGDNEVLSRAENLWQQARLFIGETAQQVQSYRRLQAERQTERLQEVGRALITTFDMDELMDVMARELPRLGIPSSYLCLYERRPELAQGEQAMLPQECKLILAYGEDGRIELEPGGRRFPFRELVPDGMLPRERCYSMVVEGLYSGDHQLGFALFEAGPRDGAVYEVLRGQISSALQGALLFRERQQAEEALEQAYAEVEKKVEERTAELEREVVERERAQAESLRLQQEVIEAQKQALRELSTPVIPIMERIIVMPLIGSIDTLRARDITRALLAGISEHQARVVILDITGVPIVDSGVAAHLNKTIQAARLKGARAIVTGISDAVAETVVDLGIDWRGIKTLSDLQTGLNVALNSLGIRLTTLRS